jgi:hypothetical protein
MKKFLFFPVLLFLSIALQASGSNLYASLVDVNARWVFEKDFPSWVHNAESEENPIQKHLFLVHGILKQRSTDHLTEPQKQNREKYLTFLDSYAKRGKFPENVLESARKPVFIDPFGTHCAVGYLIKESGSTALAQRISRNMNYSYLLDMKDETLMEWVSESGFTAEELAWVQPGYPPVGEGERMGEGMNGPVYSILPVNGDIIAAGRFDTAGTVEAKGISTWISGIAGFDWINFGQGALEYEVLDMEAYNGGIIAAGNIFWADSMWVGSGVAFWDGSSWNPLGSFYIGALQNTVMDIEVYNNEIYAAGQFRSGINASSVFYNFAKWDGTEWVSAGFSPQGTVYALEEHQGNLILGGSFNTIDTIPCNHIASFDGTNYSPLGNGVPTYVYALESVDDSLFAGGPLLSPSQQDTFGFGYYSNGQWNKIEGLENTDNLAQQKVLALEQTPYGLFVGGSLNYFPVIGRYGKNLLYYANGSLAPFAVLDSTVNTLSYSNSVLYAGGEFKHGFFNFAQPDELNHIVYFDLAQNFSLNDGAVNVKTSLYPNPAQDEFSLEFDQKLEIQSFQLTDVTGRKVRMEMEKKGDKKYHFTLQQNVKGLYLLSIQTAEGVLEKKIILQY